MNVWLNHLLQLFFPRTCAGCAADIPVDGTDALCRACWDDLPRLDGLGCRVCGLPLPDGGARCYVCRHQRRRFFMCRSVGLYEGVLKECIHKLKYGGKDYIAEPLGRLLAEKWRDTPELFKVDAVVPVPLHFWRERRRGYNQSHLLAESFCQKTSLPLWSGHLRRVRLTRTQTELSREFRFANVDGAFSARNTDPLKGRTLLLVDDVCTTGATLEACAQALKTAGARRILALTVARQT